MWLLLFSALGFVSGTRSAGVIFLLLCLALLQVIEPKIPALASQTGNVVSILIKLFLGYLLIRFTGDVSSSYYLILLLPVLSAATTLGATGTALITVLACGSYLSCLLQVDWERDFLPSEGARELSLRILFLAVVAYLTYRLAEAGRVERRKSQAAVEQLALANQNLQAAEEAVRRNERLAALGQLSAGLAHELRNPLGTIRASAEMLKNQFTEGNPVAGELAGFIATEVDRANSLVTRFLEFARPLEPRLEVTELTEVLDRVVLRLERDGANRQVTVYKNYSPDVPRFRFDAELMERVFYNLLVNAAQASQPGGAVTVKTRPAGDGVEISVIDRGAGISPSDKGSIFNPFFTTKPDGVGLGLAIVSKIVEGHGGKMAFESELGKGSVFHVYLPLHSE